MPSHPVSEPSRSATLFPFDLAEARLAAAAVERLRATCRAAMPERPGETPVIALSEIIPIWVELGGEVGLCRQPVFEIVGWTRAGRR